MLSELAIESQRDRMLLLRSLPAFAPLDADDLSLLAEHVRVRHVRAGEVLLTLGEPIHHVYVVLEGRVRWQRKDQPAAVAERQQVVGWLTLMARDPNGADASPETDSVVLELPAEILEHTIETNFGFVRNLLRLGAGQLVSARGHLPAPSGRPPPFDMGVLRPEGRTLVERLIAMRKIPIFSRCNVEALIALVRSTQPVRAEPGEVFWRVGETAPFWIVVEYGRVRCTSQTGEVMDIGANYTLGVLDAVAQQPRSYEACAESVVLGNRIELAAFLGVLEIHVPLARDYLEILARAVLDRS